MNRKKTKARLIAISITLIFASFFLLSCGSAEESPLTAVSVTLIEQSWLNGAGIDAKSFYGYDTLSSSELGAITEAAKEQGITISLSDDLLVLKDEGGRKILLSQWQNAAEKASLPRPEHGALQYTVVDGDYFSACYFEYENAEFEAYIAELKKAGFSLDIIEETVNTGSVFYAQNIHGYTVSAVFTDKVLIIVCEK